MRAALAALNLLIAATPALAQAPDEDPIPVDPACIDAQARDLCAHGRWSEIVMRFGLEPAEIIQRKGLHGVRILMMDGYGGDLPVISILAEGSDEAGDPVNAKLDVRWQVYRGEKAELSSLTREAWPNIYWGAIELQELVAEAPEEGPEPATRSNPVDPANPDREIVTICLHPWTTITESIVETGVIRRIRNSCDDDPVHDASYDMARESLRGFPHCNHIDPKNERNHATQLRSCFGLDGVDKLAAAEVLNLRAASIDTPADLAPWMSPGMRLTLPGGAVVSGPAAAAAALAGHPALKDTDLYTHNFAGEPGKVVVLSTFYRDVKGRDAYEEAFAYQVWRQHDVQWRLTELTIAPFKVIDY